MEPVKAPLYRRESVLTLGDLFKKSNIDYKFAVPIYSTHVEPNAFSKIQQEFDVVYTDLRSNNKFQHNEKSNSHMLSDITFTKNLLNDYQTDEFKKELDKHLRNYMEGIDSDIGIARPFEYNIESSWMTLNTKNSYAVVHSHGDTDIAGVYYFKTNGNDGDFFFETPNKLTKSSYCFRHWQCNSEHKPEVGKIMLFPGWLEHGVGTNHTDNDRVSISFNINFVR